MSADEAFAALGKRIDELAQIPFRAWERYRADIAPGMAKPPKSTRASVMQALMVEELAAAFGGAVIYRKGRALLCDVPGLIVQCKKLNDRGLPQNYPTKTALRFAYQLHIPGIPPATRLTLGYMLNALGTEISEVRLLAQMGQGVAWSRELTVNQTINSILVPTAATTTVQPAATAPKKRTLQPKGAAKTEETEEDKKKKER